LGITSAKGLYVELFHLVTLLQITLLKLSLIHWSFRVGFHGKIYARITTRGRLTDAYNIVLQIVKVGLEFLRVLQSVLTDLLCL